MLEGWHDHMDSHHVVSCPGCPAASISAMAAEMVTILPVIVGISASSGRAIPPFVSRLGSSLRTRTRGPIGSTYSKGADLEPAMSYRDLLDWVTGAGISAESAWSIARTPLGRKAGKYGFCQKVMLGT